MAWGYFTLLRMDGVDGGLSANLNWRWSPTSEDRFKTELASMKIPDQPAADETGAKPLVLQPGDWPAFRGANRDGGGR